MSRHRERLHLLEVLGGGLDVVLGGPRIEVELGLELGKSARQIELVGNTLDTVSRVDVLDQDDLEAGGATLAGDDGRGSKEVLPNL